jgi:hypothetical protein
MSRLQSDVKDELNQGQQNDPAHIGEHEQAHFPPKLDCEGNSEQGEHP